MYGFIYSVLVIPLLNLLIRLIRIFNHKLDDREKNVASSLLDLDRINAPGNSKTVWFHAASMGEFEQAKPVIELIKENHPGIKIVCSFFSPSGYNNQKNYKFADAVVYLPFDTKKNARKFINKVNPSLAVFVRYEIWRNYLSELKRRHIPAFLICATMPGSKALRTTPIVKNFYNSIYNLFSRIFTVAPVHTDYFKSSGCKSEVVTLTDTRFDRIIKNVESAATNPVLPRELFDNEFVLVAGSSWPPDENLILEGMKSIFPGKKVRLIIVPHEPTESHLSELKNKVSDIVLLSDILLKLENKEDVNLIKSYINGKTIVVDSIGRLLRLYASADAAYIGGAFGVGVHSVTEPAGYGIPLATGPKMTNSPDASSLRDLGALTVLETPQDFTDWLNNILTNPSTREKAGRIAKDYVFSAKGSSYIIYNEVIKALN